MSTTPQRFGPSLTDADKAELLDQIAEHLPLCINVQDTVAGKFVYVSRAWEEMTGLPVEQWLDDPEVWVAVIHPEDRAYAEELANERIEGYRTSRDIRILHRDGAVHWIHGWLAPIADESGKLVRVIGISEDITAQKKIEAQLRGANLKLEQRLRSQEVELSGLRQQLSSRDELGRSREEIEAGHKSYESLTSREQEVFERIVAGATNPAIAEEFGIAVATVKIHRRRIMRKFDAVSFAALVAKAVRCGLTDTLEIRG